MAVMAGDHQGVTGLGGNGTVPVYKDEFRQGCTRKNDVTSNVGASGPTSLRVYDARFKNEYRGTAPGERNDGGGLNP